jgi:uncharacterized repeat protein (TIGR04138 family)
MSSENDPVNPFDAIKKIRERDRRYSPEAYAMVMDSLEFGIRRIGERRHLSAKELLEHMCEFARERYGMLAFSVLNKWGVRTTDDVGAIVYRLIDERVLAEQSGDSPADFQAVFDLGELLEDRYFDGRPNTEPPKPNSG